MLNVAINLKNLTLLKEKPFVIKRKISKYQDSFRISLYADDTCSVTSRGLNSEHIVYNQRSINSIREWTDEYEMIMNVSKLQRVNFGTKNIDEDYFYGDTRIPSVPSARLLGVNFVLYSRNILIQ